MSGARQQIGPDSPAEANRRLYEADEHEWMAQQIAALRTGRFQDLDSKNLAEFLDDAMSRDRRELRSRFSRLLHHLLKVRMQPEKLSRSWVRTIVHQQNEVNGIFRDIPSISQHAERLFAEAHTDTVRESAAETGIPARQFPPASPWSIEEALTFAVPEPAEPSASGSRKSSRFRS